MLIKLPQFTSKNFNYFLLQVPAYSVKETFHLKNNNQVSVKLGDSLYITGKKSI